MKVFAEDKPVDIWNIEEKDQKKQNQSNDLNTQKVDDNNSKINSVSDIFSMQSQKKTDSIKLENSLETKNIKIYGLYDPEEYNLDINMWSNSNGNQLKNILLRLNKINLSEDATEIMKIALLTNSYAPNIDISEDEFLTLRSDWLIKNSDLDLIEKYLVKNQIFDLNPKLTKYLLDQHLSESNIEKACDILSKNLKPINNDYLSKFNIYCLIITDKKEEAQLFYDLKKELGFKDKYFEKKN